MGQACDDWCIGGALGQALHRWGQEPWMTGASIRPLGQALDDSSVGSLPRLGVAGVGEGIDGSFTHLGVAGMGEGIDGCRSFTHQMVHQIPVVEVVHLH